MPSYKFPSRVLADDDSAFENELADAHQSRFRPVCLCLTPAPEMYIARLGDKYFIKRMPGTGLTHHHGCEHFDPPPSLSGLGDVMGRAIQQKDDGHTVLKLDFSLTKVARSAPAQTSESKSDTVKAETNKLTLLGLLLVYLLPDTLGYYVSLGVIFNAANSIGDLWMTAVVRRYPPTTLVRDQADSIRIYTRK